ncbi:MAG: recombination protein RecR [Candidatus Vogelbacteria bacterium CG10_big_fil_rev_8_21_14_0_10_50_13]|uniref:Recombination protein RecR n=1 Tax=Candidatus Vogelbacteria bacterium CG10_big_fil_rev_8_21_14_0_10_50_13 TaxID=1975044 RepID=A0A2H0RFR5_9BACT|nr:MAG: recombination protein RecR [Candidatus Vogelbacteria bacterium CG10_big_fil_rev_8_21_14_0_10_50_13]
MGENLIQELAAAFTRFPGVGPRQAKRFVYFLLKSPPTNTERLARLIDELRRKISQCGDCRRFVDTVELQAKQCALCRHERRDHSLLLVVEKDIDVNQIERAGSYEGRYFVLGGLVPLLEDEPDKRIRLTELKKYLDRHEIKELIVALTANAEGDNTAEYLQQTLKKYEADGLVVTVLGRGLSSGIELEYSDPDTIKHALSGRIKIS